MSTCGLNRTFMELKSVMTLSSARASVSQSYLYGIEMQQRPIWFAPTSRSQSYLYGIEMLDDTAAAVVEAGLNRTFMELKSVS